MGHSKVLTVKQFAKAQENHCQTKALFVRLHVKAFTAFCFAFWTARKQLNKHNNI